MKPTSPYRFIAAAFVMFAFSPSVLAKVTLPSIINSNMVIQRGKPVKIWGWAKPGEVVNVRYAGKLTDKKTGAAENWDNQKNAGADKDGNWSITFPAHKLTGGPATMTISGDDKGDDEDDKNVIELKNILIGEVWLCSGQSNMEWTMRGTDDAKKEIAAANYPNIRLFHVPRVPAGKPAKNIKATWKTCTPVNAQHFSAVGFFFGRELHKKLDVPIGLINASWGGTRIEPWTPPEGFRLTENWVKLADGAEAANKRHQENKLKTVALYEQWLPKAQAAAKAGRDVPEPPKWPKNPVATPNASTGLYNGMIAPLVRFQIQGAIWYQGESNRGLGMKYYELMQALIGGWRKVWHAKPQDFPFYFVQLAPYNYGNFPTALPEIWEAQTKAMATIPNTGMVVTTDIGNTKDIHPRNKQDVGKRLALWALAKTYKQKGVVYSGPIFKEAKYEKGRAVLTFDHTGGGLTSRDGKPLSHFQLAGKDQNFFPAKATIKGDAIVVTSTGVAEPLAVRFGWSHVAEPNLMNEDGLPASPFRTDDWSVKKK